MSDKYDRLSLVPGYEVDPKTGESHKIDLNSHAKSSTTSPSQYDRKITQIACNLTGEMGEKALAALTGGVRHRKGNMKGGDIILPDQRRIESKTARLQGVTVIKKRQLEQISDKGFYGLVFYKTKTGEIPSRIAQRGQNMNISTEAYIKRNIGISKIFVFPKGYIVNFYNDPALKECHISGTNVLYKGLRYSKAHSIFEENPGDQEKFEARFKYKKHIIDVLSIGYEPKQHRHGLLLPHDYED